jgi:flavin-dependent dehydrogenase
MYDAIVVGARCAGSPTAMLLARQGYRVLLVDRARFPSDTMSTHYIRQPGVLRLQRWGLLERVVASNCPDAACIRLDCGDIALSGHPTPAEGVGAAFAPRRTVLDAILVEAAVAAGAEFHERFTVRDLLIEDGAVVGIKGHGASGALMTERAPLVIGADGLHSLVARRVAAPIYHEHPSLTCYYYSYWSGVPAAGIDIFLRGRRLLLTFPTNDGLTLILAGWPNDAFRTVRADIEGSFQAALATVPDLAERVRQGRREERFVGTAVLPNFFRQPYGRGWALVGDAGFHKDPYFAQGISDAFRDAELLAEAIDTGLSGRRPLMEVLAAYQAQRDEQARPLYELNLQGAALQPQSGELLGLLRALQGNQEDTDRFLGVGAGTVPVPVVEFYTPHNLARIAGAAARETVPAVA